MRRTFHGRWTWLVLGVAGFAGACNNQDVDGLTRVARKVSQKSEGLTTTASDKLAAGWQALRAHMDEVAVDARVAARIRWDRTLAGLPIEVQGTSGQVQLRGQVRTAEQRQRAVELAESTSGVEKVADELEIVPE